MSRSRGRACVQDELDRGVDPPTGCAMPHDDRVLAIDEL